MKKNIGRLDQIFRFLLGVALATIGLWPMNGRHGNIWGILLAIGSLLPFYMAFSRSCLVFRWVGIHSLSRKECELQQINSK